MTRDEMTEMEELLDKYSVTQLLSALADVCNEKAIHLETNWQDRSAAKSWDRDAAKLAKWASRVEN